MKTFGQKLKELREGKRLTQQELADVCGVGAPVTVGRWEGDKTIPEMPTLKKLCVFFDYNLLAHVIPDLPMEGVQNPFEVKVLESLGILKKQLDRIEAGQRPPKGSKD